MQRPFAACFSLPSAVADIYMPAVAHLNLWSGLLESSGLPQVQFVCYVTMAVRAIAQCAFKPYNVVLDIDLASLCRCGI